MHLTIADYILELVQNAVESGARTIDLRVTQDDAGMQIEVADDGCGMNEEQRSRCLDPYMSAPDKHPGRPAGLGLSLLAQLLDGTGGKLAITTAPGKGTRVTARFNGHHLDTPPPGELEELFLSALCLPEGNREVRIERRLVPAEGGPSREYRLSRKAIHETLGNMEDIAALTALRKFLRQQETQLVSTKENTRCNSGYS